MIINYLIAYAVYFLGASLFVLDLISKYQKIADANPDTTITFNSGVFWRKERFNIIRVLLLGIVTIILLIPLKGLSVDFKNSNDAMMFTLPIETILLPLYLIFGWSGGKATIALAGKYKQGLYEKVGITEPKEE